MRYILVPIILLMASCSKMPSWILVQETENAKFYVDSNHVIRDGVMVEFVLRAVYENPTKIEFVKSEFGEMVSDIVVNCSAQKWGVKNYKTYSSDGKYLEGASYNGGAAHDVPTSKLELVKDICFGELTVSNKT